MAKAKKLPSGSWRVSAYSHTDANGKQHRVSFTASTKQEAEAKAAAYAANKHHITYYDKTVSEAIDGYINAKEAVLSPSTIRAYDNIRKKHFKEIGKKKIKVLTSEDVQLFISGLAETCSPKTVKNIYALLTASISLYSPDTHFKVTLPTQHKKRPASPSREDVATLYKNATTSMKLVIGLAMVGFRCGEMCALKYEDIADGVAHIHADFVQDKNKEWIYKDTPKEADSDRFVKLPDFVLDLIGEGEGFIINANPKTVSKRFYKYRLKQNINIRLHDIRHFYASSAVVLGIPDIYLADMGGWSRTGNSPVMKSVYQNNIKSMSDYYNKKISDYMTGIVETVHETVHENSKTAQPRAKINAGDGT